MATIYDVDPNELIEAAAKELQKMDTVQAPEWAMFVKTGHFKERPPARDDWWHIRAAAVLRKVYKLGPIGVSKLRGAYGGRKNNGMGAEHSYKGSGNIIRKILQQLEKSELLRQGKIGVHKGRIITPKGKKLLDSVATKLIGVKGKEKKGLDKKEVKVETPKVPKEAKPEVTKEHPKEAKPEVKEEQPKEAKPEVKKEQPKEAKPEVKEAPVKAQEGKKPETE